MNCLHFNIYDVKLNENYLYPFLGLFGLMITYFGNKFIKPTLFLGGMITSSTSSYKLTEGSLDWKLKQKYGFGTKCDCSWFWENANDREKSMDAYLSYLLNNSRLDWVNSNA